LDAALKALGINPLIPPNGDFDHLGQGVDDRNTTVQTTRNLAAATAKLASGVSTVITVSSADLPV